MLQAKRSTTFTEERAPIGDAALSRLYRANPSEIAEIVTALPDDVRVRLVAFCYARAHLRPIGLEIATHCDDGALIRHAGAALGRSLVELRQQRQSDDQSGTDAGRARVKVTLATAADMRRREPRFEETDEFDNVHILQTA